MAFARISGGQCAASVAGCSSSGLTLPAVQANI